MEKLELKNVYYSQDPNVKEYMQIYLDTNSGFMKYAIANFVFTTTQVDILPMNRLEQLDVMKKKYGVLYIQEVRKSYDNDMYLLISNLWILAIEYILNSVANHTFQEIKFIEDLNTTNKHRVEFFKELEIVTMPGSG